VSEPRFTLGIDLGTTHTAIAFTRLDDRSVDAVEIHDFAIPQTIAPFEVDERPMLPSNLYLPGSGEFAAGAAALPWSESNPWFVGEFAKTHGASVPTRLVASAKSWLSHGGVDRKAPSLPQDAEAGLAKVSPFDASRAYLAHVRDAWNEAFPAAPFEDQQITITVPASFDPVAQMLTAEAAESVGARLLSIVEEPQAALHAYLASHAGDLGAVLREHDVLLVVDVGGGTTDFSLIAIDVVDGLLSPRRIAVSDHILLGGDNMDLAVAALADAAFVESGVALDDAQRRGLGFAAQRAKERLLGGEDAATIAVSRRGSRLIAGTASVELARAPVETSLLEGFFPEVSLDARPNSRARSALTTLGLPYAQDPAITRHLANFLTQHRHALDPSATARLIHPTAILFNGGVFRAEAFASRLASVLDRWLVADGASPARRLAEVDLDRQVARGAAYHGFVRHRGGIRIRGGTARAIYVGVETAAPAIPGLPPPMNAICVAPFGLEHGASAAPMDDELGLVVGEPVRVVFFGSTDRRDDRVGSRAPSVRDLSPLGELELTLPASSGSEGEVLPVRLAASVADDGTLRLHAFPRGGGDPVVLEFDLPGH